MSLSNLEAVLGGAAFLLLGAALVLLYYARNTMAEARRLRGRLQAAGASAQVQAGLLDVTPTLIAALDGMHRYLAVNKAFEETVGSDRSQLIGVEASRLPGEAGSLGAQLENFAAQCVITDQAITEVINFRTASGRFVDGLLIVRPYYSEDAKRGALVAVVDISARLAAEREAREIKDTVEDLVATLPMAFFRLREEIDGNRRISYLVGHTDRFLRTSLNQIHMNSGGLPRSNVLEDYWPAARAALEESRSGHTPIQIDLPMHRPEDEGWLRIGTAVPRSPAEGVTEWNGYLLDVTQEHRDGLALSQAKAAAEANAEAKSRFLAVMSHEIRTPLATAVGALEMLRNSPLDATQHQHVELADNASHLLMEIIGDVLDFSRLEAGQLAVEAIPFSIRELFDQVLPIFSPGARRRGLTLDLCIAREVAAEFVGDPVRIKQIVINLVGNAVKFTATGGIVVTVSVDPDLAPGDGAGQQLIISVADTGIGITREMQHRLFDPFAQGDASIARKFGGSGLGLAISMRLARLLGGDIRVESQENRGSVFETRLPLQVTRPSDAEPAVAGKRIAIEVRRNQDEKALRAYAETLGFSLVHAHEDADARIVDADRPMPPGGPPVIQLVQEGPPASAAARTPQILSGNPIRWQEFRKICLTILQLNCSVTQMPAGLPENSKDGPPLRILVVEDHAPYQIVVRNLLEKLGGAPDVVANASDALQLMERNRYALVITDCHLPDMDGFELARSIRKLADPGLRGLPVIGLSADLSPDHVQRSREAGMNDFLVKPVNLATLRACIEKWTRP